MAAPNHHMNPAFFPVPNQQQIAQHLHQIQQANQGIPPNMNMNQGGMHHQGMNPGMNNQNMNPAMNAFRIGMNGQPIPNNTAADDDSDVFDEDTDALSRISITIRSPILITGNNNLIASDAAATANAIALGVVQSLRQMSMGQHGIPMIDEQGRPRPLGVEVIAEMRIEGSQNVVGERAVLARMLDLKEKAKERAKEARAREHAHGCANAHGGANTNGQGNRQGNGHGNANGIMVKLEKKRDRDSSEEVEADAESKRTRRD